jgi:hypothetical protein
MLESEGVQTSSLQKIQTPGDSNPTQVFIGTAPAQRNPSPPDNNQIPVAKEPVQQKHVNSLLGSVCVSSHHEIL